MSRLLRIKNADERQSVSEEEIKYMVTDNDELLPDEKRMIHDILDLGDMTVHEIMQPRVDMILVEDTETVRQAVDRMRGTGYSRLPVFHEDIDRIVGIVHYKDLVGPLMDGKENEPVADYAYEALFVPETKDLFPLLSEMQTNRQQMAIVVDEYGGTDGLITVEDIVEEVVGEIVDETDRENPFIEQESENVWVGRRAIPRRRCRRAWMAGGGFGRLRDHRGLAHEHARLGAPGGRGTCVRRIPLQDSGYAPPSHFDGARGTTGRSLPIMRGRCRGDRPGGSVTSEKRLLRSRKALIGGVCAGRGPIISTSILSSSVSSWWCSPASGGLLGIAYILLWIVLPLEPKEEAPLDVHPQSVHSETYGTFEFGDTPRKTESGAQNAPNPAQAAGWRYAHPPVRLGRSCAARAPGRRIAAPLPLRADASRSYAPPASHSHEGWMHAAPQQQPRRSRRARA